MGERGADLLSWQALPVRRRRDHAAAGAAADPLLCRLVLAALDRTRRTARLQFDRRTVRRGDDLWRVAPGAGPLRRDLRAPRPFRRPADVQLFPAFRRLG